MIRYKVLPVEAKLGNKPSPAVMTSNILAFQLLMRSLDSLGASYVEETIVAPFGPSLQTETSKLLS